MDILGILGFVFAATATGALVYEHQTDVLNGPYIEGRAKPRKLAAIFDPARALADALMERLTWNAHHAVYLASLA